MEEIIRLDKEFFLFLNTLGNSKWDGFWSFISEKYYWIPFYAFLLFLLWRNFGWKKTLFILVLTAIMIIISDQITNLIKDNVKRLRPCHLYDFEGIMRAVGCERRGQYGFTSAHSSNHFAIALFLGLIFKEKIKWFIYFLLIWAAVIAYSRIYLGVHFPLDIICGGLMGLIIGFVFYRIYLCGLKKYSFFS